MTAKTEQGVRDEQVNHSRYALVERNPESTGKAMRASCCDVFRLQDGKVYLFPCHAAVPIPLEQLGEFMNLQATLRH